MKTLCADPLERLPVVWGCVGVNLSPVVTISPEHEEYSSQGFRVKLNQDGTPFYFVI